MNVRQLRLKNMIDSGNIPVICDATFIYDKIEENIPFHWGDLEVIGYGSTYRYYDFRGEKYLTRHYTGPGEIIIQPQNVSLKTGMSISDD